MESAIGIGRCFVTGAAGFIGSHLVEHLLAAGNSVTGYDNLSSGRVEWLSDVRDAPCFRFVRADLLDAATLRRAMEGHDAVFHLGGNTDIPIGTSDPSIDLKNCTIATFNVLEAMRATGVRTILFASSSTVYGEPAVRPTPESYGPLLPESHYGAAKLACEGLISAFCALHGLQGWLYRFGNVLGARMGHGVLVDFIRKLESDPVELEILGDGKQEKNYFLVEDCIDGMLYAYRHSRDRACDVFNLGCESNVIVDQIAQIVIEEMSLKDVQLRYTGGDRGWPGDVPKVIYDLSKMKRLGWEPRHNSADAVRAAVRRLLDQRRTAAGAS